MQKIIADLKAGNYQPIYLLHGEEPYFIDKISQFIEHNILNEGEQAFNQMVFYGKDSDAQQIIDACTQFPMMSSHRVVILKEAQSMRTLKNLEKYIANPSPSTILCICHKHKKLDTRSKFGKLLKSKAVVFESSKMYDNQLPGYINSLAKSKGYQIEAQATQLVAEYIGSDLSTLHNEMEKLFLSVAEGSTIDMNLIQSQIGISKDYNVFELQSAIGARNFMKAYRIGKYFQDNPKKNPIIMIIPTLYRFFTKVWVVAQNGSMNDKSLGQLIGVYNSFFMKDYRLAARNFHPLKIEEIFSILKEYDLKSKGVENRSYPGNELLIEMIARILN